MKTSFFKIPLQVIAFIACFVVAMPSGFSQFQRVYGNTGDNSFTKVIPVGLEFYLLGSEGDKATVSRVSNTGQLLWTRTLTMPSALVDAVLTPNTNDLMFVGFTRPFDNSTKSILGVVTSQGYISAAIAYDTPGSEIFSNIVVNPGSPITYSVLGFHSPQLSTQETVLLKVDANANIISKKRFSGPDSRFAYDLDIVDLGGGAYDYLVSGAWGTTGVIYRMSSTGVLVNGILESDAYYFQDVRVLSGSSPEVLAVASSSTGASPRVIRLDANLFPKWDVEIAGMDDLTQVMEGNFGDIYVLGTAVVNGKSRAVLSKLNDDGSGNPGQPVLIWSRYLDNTETSFTGGSFALLQLGNIAFADGRTGNPNGSGLNDAFLAKTNGNFTSDCTVSANMTLVPHNAIWNSPDVIPFLTYDPPPGLDLLWQNLPWNQAGGCGVLTPGPVCGDIKLRVEPDQDGRQVFYDGVGVEGDHVSLECDPPPGTFMPVGVTQVVCTARDTSGNEASCTFTVTVEKMPFDSMQPPPILSPDGNFDKVRDRYGNPYRLSEIQIPEAMSGSLLCGGSGYFNLYFEPGCGMEGSSPVEVARRNVLCQVFTDLSQFITTPNPNVRVNIWIRDINQTGASLTSTLGLATSFYTMPAGAPNLGGLVDGEVWKTINSGVDSYTGVSSPLITGGGAGAGFYHGYMAFNFSNPSQIDWHTNLSTVTSASLYDFYSVALHEATHALGFASLIAPPSGQSGFGPGFTHYYSRYDCFLKTPAGQPLITNGNACSSMYNYQFNTALNPNVFYPNPNNLPFDPNHTDCTTAIKFVSGSVTQPVFTPNYYMGGSSLSHFEDECHLLNGQFNPKPNDEYYVMSNANGRGPAYMKRYLKPEERLALCELGYKVATTYGNPGQLTLNNYTGGICNGVGVAGVNDGIGTNGAYTYQANPNGAVSIAPLTNDFGAVSYECLEVVFGGGTVSTTSGTGSFTYNAPNTPGIKLLRYVPVGAGTGVKKGNITYILVYVKAPGCPATACNMVANGGFESSVNCGPMSTLTNGSNVVIDCWESLAATPDLFVRNCAIPFGTNLNVSTFNSNPATDSHNGSPNNKILGLHRGYYGAAQVSEAAQTGLTSPLIPGVMYEISFWAKTNNNINGPSSNIPARIHFASDPSFPLAKMLNYYPGSSFPPLLPEFTIPNDNAWHYMNQVFTFSGTAPHTNLIVAYGALTLPPGVVGTYVFLDDVKLTPLNTALTFTPPSPLCLTAPPAGLNNTVSIPGGTFTGSCGACVTNNGGNYAFNPSVAGLGNHVITYTVTDANGCTASVTATIQVVQGPMVTFSFPVMPPKCLNDPPIGLNLLASPAGGAFSGPGVNCAGTTCTFIPANAGVGTHTITYTYTGGACPVSVTASIQVNSCIDTCEISNRCLDFDGVNDQVNVPSPLSATTDPGAFTVACWFRDDRTSGPNDYRIFSWPGSGRFELMTHSNGLLSFYNNNTGLVASTVNVRDNKWHHVAVVRSGGSVSIYYDGQPVTGMSPVPGAVLLPGLPSPLVIGNYSGSTSSASWWQGRIDEFKIWGAALTAAQIRDEMFCSLDPNNANLLVHFPFDQFIAYGNNTGMTLAQNVVTGGANGTLINFTLTGNTSNWVGRGRDRLPNCNPDHFAWIEGNNGRNYAGRSKVYDADIFTIGTEVINGVSYPTFTRRDYKGTVVWRTRITKTGYINDFIRTDEGCFLLVGQLPIFKYDNRSFIARIDQNGNLDWLHEHNFAERESLTRIIRSDNPDNPLYPNVVCGIRKNANTSNDDVLLLTVDNQGNIGWIREIGNKLPLPTDDNFCFDLINYNGGYALVGTYDRNGIQHPVLFITDNTGMQLSPSSEYQTGIVFYDVKPAVNGQDILLAGQLTAGGSILAKVNASGTQIWALQFPNIKILRKLVVRPNGDIYAVGQRNYIGKYRNVLVKARDFGNSATVIWQKHAELTPTEINWTPADLAWYSGKMFFFSDSRVQYSFGWLNENIGAALYDLDQTPDICPFTKEIPVSQPYSLVQAAMPGLTNILVTPLAPVVSTPGISLTIPRDSLCPSYSCTCNFASMAFSKPGLPGTGWYVPVATCGLPPIPLPGCPSQTTPIKFIGQLKCKGGCAFSGLSWTLTDPNNLPVSSGTSSTPSFSNSITLAMVQIPGTYTMTVVGKCGTTTCTCIVQFIMPACPAPCLCTQPAFTNAVNNGFNWLQLPSCNFKFTPKSLTSCDKVTWKVAKSGTSNFTTLTPITTGNQTINYQFPSTDQYVVCMTVTRTPPTGSPCTVSRCWTIDVDCSLVLKPDDNGAENLFNSGVCMGSVVENSGFTLDAEEGGMADIGAAAQWNSSGGNPEVVLEMGKDDANFVRMRGNGRFTDLLYQDSLPVNAWDSIGFSMALRPIYGLVLPGTELVVRLSAQRQDSLWCSDSTCLELMRLPIPDLDSSIWLRASSFATLRTVALPYLTIHVENPFIDDDIALQSVVDIDNVCLSKYDIVSTDQPAAAKFKIWVFPNPTTNYLNIRISQPLPESTQLRLYDTWGRLLRESNFQKGETAYSLNTQALPQGMYFLQVVSERTILATEKFVKQ